MVKDPVRRHEHAVSEEAVRERTGRSREEWFTALDEAGATAWTHPRIARWLGEEHGVDAWWCQSLTVGYEQARGMRAPGQRPDGTFETSSSVTVPVAVESAWAWCTEPERRDLWLDEPIEVRGQTPHKTVRWTAADGRRVLLSTDALPEGTRGPRTRVAVTHRGLSSSEEVAQHKERWAARLRRLKELTTGD
ncbi:DUF4287 domain-containing protein [Actinotalea sp. Marseille-Q4924]|uniref:DUF4287 domain-containing protein n=1 Tax=Actinotalea sp. Marseille-Q4924 TaxID=2866571 RepID=UPI001CE3EA42|nr:DUF4287 domain-containing protein [Actinotalea sp. Marseille-Q4924]